MDTIIRWAKMSFLHWVSELILRQSVRTSNIWNEPVEVVCGYDQDASLMFNFGGILDTSYQEAHAEHAVGIIYPIWPVNTLRSWCINEVPLSYQTTCRPRKLFTNSQTKFPFQKVTPQSAELLLTVFPFGSVAFVFNLSRR